MTKDLFNFEAEKPLYAVMGNPIAHSKSPRVHELFAKQTGISLEYHAIHVEVGGFEQAVSNFAASGGKGLNITVPFKVNAWKLADELSERANRSAAVNTLVLEDKIRGDNTDGVGLITDIESNLGIGLAGARILIIGAGGAVRGILGSLINKQPEKLVIANRTKDKATELASAFSNFETALSGCGLEEVNHSFDVVINATTTAMTDQVPDINPLVFQQSELAYDMVYKKQSTSFQSWALESGAKKTANGLGMLVEQAAESFFIWHRVRPDTRPVLNTLESEMQ